MNQLAVEQPRLLRRSSPMAPRCQACGRAFADLDYLTGKPTTKCVCGRKRPAETQEDHGYTTRIGLAMPSEPEAIPESVQEEYSKQVREQEAAKLEELRTRALAATIEIEAMPAATYKTKKQLRSARKRLESLHTQQSAL